MYFLLDLIEYTIQLRLHRFHTDSIRITQYDNMEVYYPLFTLFNGLAYSNKGRFMYKTFLKPIMCRTTDVGLPTSCFRCPVFALSIDSSKSVYKYECRQQVTILTMFVYKLYTMINEKDKKKGFLTSFYILYTIHFLYWHYYVAIFYLILKVLNVPLCFNKIR